MKTFFVILTCCILTGKILNAQQASWSFDAFGGVPYNIPSPLIIKQNNESTIRLFARYYSEPLTLPVYWIWRISRVENKRGWEFEAMHHKLYLENMPPEVQQFSISHGYNILTVNRSYEKLFMDRYACILHLGAGIILAHPENIVRYKGLNPEGGLFELGYYFTGPVLNFAITKRFYFINRAYVNTEFKINPSVSWVPVGGGYAVVYNLPVAFVFGLGFDFIKQKEK